ncbi:TPA: hypothetical protein ACG3KH_004070 [Clostridioides difficile]
MMFWKSPEAINEEQLKSTKDMIDKWLRLIDKIRENLLQNSTILENNKDYANQRHIILSELSNGPILHFQFNININFECTLFGYIHIVKSIIRRTFTFMEFVEL